MRCDGSSVLTNQASQPASHMESLNGIKLTGHQSTETDRSAKFSVTPAANQPSQQSAAYGFLLPDIYRKTHHTSSRKTRCHHRPGKVAAGTLSSSTSRLSAICCRSQSMIGALRQCMACCCFSTISSLALAVCVVLCSCVSVCPRSEEETKHRFQRQFFLSFFFNVIKLLFGSFDGGNLFTLGQRVTRVREREQINEEDRWLQQRFNRLTPSDLLDCNSAIKYFLKQKRRLFVV